MKKFFKQYNIRFFQGSHICCIIFVLFSLLISIFNCRDTQAQSEPILSEADNQTLYIRNQPYNGSIIKINNILYGELSLIAPLVKLRLIQNGNQFCFYRFTDKETTCPPKTKTISDMPALFIYDYTTNIILKEYDGKIFVPLPELAKIVGAKYLHNEDTGIIDLAFRTLVVYDPNEIKPVEKKNETASQKKSSPNKYTGKLSILFVYQSDCPKCETLSPILYDLERASNGRIKVTPINVMSEKDTDPYDKYLDALVGKKNDLVTPGLILHDEKGKVLKTQNGVNISSRTALDKWLGQYKP